MSDVMADVEASSFDLALVVLLGLGVAGALWLARFALDVAPMTARRREQLRRALPLASGAVIVLALLFGAGVLFSRYPAHMPYAVAAIVGGLAFASWFAIRDAVSGIFVKAGRMSRIGDRVRVGEIEGRVVRMGRACSSWRPRAASTPRSPTAA
ncbi:MAG: mechanosensitive ion channel family protein [Sandaracinaceae bacterium]|nr:mechanosensitive ion channel family protein [Sandaracinaceae bacterium]